MGGINMYKPSKMVGLWHCYTHIMHPTCQVLRETADIFPWQEVEHIVKQANELSAGLHLSLAEESGVHVFDNL